jgi:hypothetical protein
MFATVIYQLSVTALIASPQMSDPKPVSELKLEKGKSQTATVRQFVVVSDTVCYLRYSKKTDADLLVLFNPKSNTQTASIELIYNNIFTFNSPLCCNKIGSSDIIGISGDQLVSVDISMPTEGKIAIRNLKVLNPSGYIPVGLWSNPELQKYYIQYTDDKSHKIIRYDRSFRQEEQMSLPEGNLDCLMFTTASPGFVAALRDDSARHLRVQLNENKAYTIRSIHSGSVHPLVVSCDEKWIATGSSDCTGSIIDTKTSKELYRFREAKRSVSSICFSRDGKFLAIGSLDSKVANCWIIDTKSWTIIGKLLIDGGVESIAIDASNTRLLTVSSKYVLTSLNIKDIVRK